MPEWFTAISTGGFVTDEAKRPWTRTTFDESISSITGDPQHLLRVAGAEQVSVLVGWGPFCRHTVLNYRFQYRKLLPSCQPQEVTQRAQTSTLRRPFCAQTADRGDTAALWTRSLFGGTFNDAFRVTSDTSLFTVRWSLWRISLTIDNQKHLSIIGKRLYVNVNKSSSSCLNVLCRERLFVTPFTWPVLRKTHSRTSNHRKKAYS